MAQHYESELPYKVLDWKERAYTDLNFGMYPTKFELWKRKCVIWQFVRFVVLSLKFYKTAAIND